MHFLSLVVLHWTGDQFILDHWLMLVRWSSESSRWSPCILISYLPIYWRFFLVLNVEWRFCLSERSTIFDYKQNLCQSLWIFIHRSTAWVPPTPLDETYGTGTINTAPALGTMVAGSPPAVPPPTTFNNPKFLKLLCISCGPWYWRLHISGLHCKCYH